MACIIHNGSEHILSIKFNNSHSYQHYKKIFQKVLEDNNIYDGECGELKWSNVLNVEHGFHQQKYLESISVFQKRIG